MRMTRSFYPDEGESVISQLEYCIADIKGWVSANKLKLNDSKTEVVHVTSRFRPTEPINPITIGNSAISAYDAARINPGGHLRQTSIYDCTRQQNVSNWLFCFTDWTDPKIALHRTSAEKLVQAFVTSSFDYCNCLLYGLPDKLINKLQRIQKS